jgi:hypothetical protein
MLRGLMEAFALPRGFRAHALSVTAPVLVPLALFSIAAWQDRAALVRAAEADVKRGADSVREHALKVLQTDALVVALIDQHIQSMSWDDIATSRSLHDYLAKLVQESPELEGLSSRMRAARSAVRAACSLRYPRQ